jgi:hypothetical protein
MSSGKIEQNYFKNVANSLIFNELDIYSEKDVNKSHFSESKTNEEKIPTDFDINNRISNIDYNFEMIQKIHFILQNSQDLTLKQKSEFCSNQRFFMKLYLKEIYIKI